MPYQRPKEESDATFNRACSRGEKKTKRLDNNKNVSFYLLGAWERRGCSCGCWKLWVGVEGGERAKWKLLIVYENALPPARNKLGPGLASLVQTYHAALQPEKIYTSLRWDIDNDKG
jgi:hypothetical protein